MSLSEDECCTLAFYLSRIFAENENGDIVGDYAETFFKIVRRANKIQSLESVVADEVSSMESRGLLTPISKNGERTTAIAENGTEIQIALPTFRGTKTKYKFAEDSEIDDEIPHENIPHKAYEINFYRALLLSDRHEGMFAEIISRVFQFGGGKKMSDGAVRAVCDTSPVAFIKDAVNLSENESRVLLFIYRMNAISEMRDIYTREVFDRLNVVCEKTLDIGAAEMNTILRMDQKLKAFGFLEADCDIPQETLECIRSGNMDAFFAEILKEEDVSHSFSAKSYAIPPESIDIAQMLLKNSKNVNILLYGAPGSGKTEFAKTLAKECSLRAFIFRNDMELDMLDNLFCRLTCLLSINKENSLIIIDEADTLLETRKFLFSMFIDGSSSARKGTVNKIFENCNNKVIWIVNHTQQIEESTKRRFTYSILFNEMPEKMLRSIADNTLKKTCRSRKISRHMHGMILDLCSQYHVTGSSIENIAKTLECIPEGCSDDEILHDVRNVLESNSALLYGKAKMRQFVTPSYDETVLNTSVPAEKIIRMVENARKFSEQNKSAQNGIRMLFYGASGTGKTEFARYISQKIGKKILLKRVSDISDKYVGESEKNIRAAFEEAEQTEQILLFDEADSFFTSRSGAEHSWERTQVNEFLTQMEEFSGILICTTNMKETMDPAMNRRFHICVQFNPLTKEGIVRLLKTYFGKYKFSAGEIGRICSRGTVTPGDFGSLAGRIRFMDEEDVDAPFIASELLKIQDDKNGSKKIGF